MINELSDKKRCANAFQLATNLCYDGTTEALLHVLLSRSDLFAS